MVYAAQQWVKRSDLYSLSTSLELAHDERLNGIIWSAWHTRILDEVEAFFPYSVSRRRPGVLIERKHTYVSASHVKLAANFQDT